MRRGIAVSAEPGLPAEVLQGVRAGHEIFRGAESSSSPIGAEDRVEAPYLQLVMLLLWEAERRANSRVLRVATLRALGGVQEAVRNRFIALMQALPLSDRMMAERLLNFLVTPSRTKIAWVAGDLSHFAQVPPQPALRLLEMLAGPDYRVLRRVEQPTHEGGAVALFELYHDVLADGILDWLGQRKRRGKRIIICCDGVWARQDAPHVTNVEKLARCVAGDPGHTDGVQQLVFYLAGTHASAARRFGMRWGWGLQSDVIAAYRFLASNYQPGDEIYLFGFSRGAYTARSLVGMIGRVGLLTRHGVNHGKLAEAVARFRTSHAYEKSVAEFARDYSHTDVTIAFLGVFETVGALGRPGPGRREAQFHDVRLSNRVLCARQALAIDELRIEFEPCLWEGSPLGDEDARIKQVWFPGSHSDVGGGYAASGLSDTTLLWMATEASRVGLVFDGALLRDYVGSGAAAIHHDPRRVFHRLREFLRPLRGSLKASRAFVNGRRRLQRPDAVSVRVASSALEELEGRAGYDPPNLRALVTSTPDVFKIVEPVIPLPDILVRVPGEEQHERDLQDHDIDVGPISSE